MAGEKGSGGQLAEGGGRPAVPGRAKGLGGVLDEPEAPAGGQLFQLVQLGALTEEVDPDQADGPAGYGGGGGLGGEGPGDRLHVCKNGPAAQKGHRLGRGVKGEGRADDLVAGLKPQGHQADHQGAGAGADADGLGPAGPPGQFGLQLAHRRPLDEPPGGQDLGHPAVDGLLVAAVLFAKIDEFHKDVSRFR